MSVIVPIRLPVRGQLDTANPVTDRPPGTLVRARDLHARYWGPRAGPKAFTRVWEGPGTASLYDAITVTGATTDAIGRSYEDQFRNLGLQFTLDLWLQYPSAAYSAGSDRVGVCEFVIGTSGGSLAVNLFGESHSDHERIEVITATTDGGVTPDAAVTVTATTRLSIGSGQTDKAHVRFVRNGASGTLLLNGVSVGSTSALHATHGIGAAAGNAGAMYLHSSGSGNTTFRGRILAAALRDGAFSSAPVEASLPCAPRARNVHFYYLGRSYALGGADHYFDAGPFGAHARIIGSNYTLAASNDNAFPAPSPIQGMRSFTTRTGRSATAVVSGGVLSHALVS